MNNNDNSSNSKKDLMVTNSVRKRSIMQIYTPGRSRYMLQMTSIGLA